MYTYQMEYGESKSDDNFEIRAKEKKLRAKQIPNEMGLLEL